MISKLISGGMLIEVDIRGYVEISKLISEGKLRYQSCYERVC